MTPPLAPGVRLVVAGVLVRDDRILATRRTRPAALAGFWEFPGGKVEAGETPVAALARELAEELGIGVTVGAEIEAAQGSWPISETLRMRVFWVASGDEPHPGDAHDAVRWLRRTELTDPAWVPADVAVAALLAERPWP
ncbi:(deoxy)nucleoside triphosphate pyrophosphohydrolase [Enemella evansiae]|uniref:(deoxy)nucleoside triphosphate pyrophosphohydrolase n=1 Tax=Enemella evansiae TaxID=2016499 RepID=UPI001E38DA47|nr:(deoxy)nucleoside triphosphate pyrophosphohydrolase [Enemella evansiae]